MTMPKNPDTIIVPADNHNYTKNITEYNIWKYYEDIKEKMLPFLKGHDLFIILKVGKRRIYRRHPYDKKTKYIRINNTTQFDKYNTGRTGEFYLTFPPMVDKVVFDLDPGKNLLWGDIKRGTRQLYDFLKQGKEFKKLEIYYTGARSFHIWGYLKGGKKNIDSLKKKWKPLLKDKFEEKKGFWAVENPKMKPNQMNVDLSILKQEGGFIAPYSMKLDTGLVATEVSPKDLIKFKKSDNTINKVYKKLIKKDYPWEIKKAYDPIKIAMKFLEALDG